MTTKKRCRRSGGCGQEDKEPQAADGVERDWQGLRKGDWLSNQEDMGYPGGWAEACPQGVQGRAGDQEAAAVPARLPLYGEAERHLLSVPSTRGRELLGLRDFISGALVFSPVRASGTNKGNRNISQQLSKELRRGGTPGSTPP